MSAESQMSNNVFASEAYLDMIKGSVITAVGLLILIIEVVIHKNNLDRDFVRGMLQRVAMLIVVTFVAVNMITDGALFFMVNGDALEDAEVDTPAGNVKAARGLNLFVGCLVGLFVVLQLMAAARMNTYGLGSYNGYGMSFFGRRRKKKAC